MRGRRCGLLHGLQEMSRGRAVRGEEEASGAAVTIGTALCEGLPAAGAPRLAPGDCSRRVPR